jgi:hypothetical protein
MPFGSECLAIKAKGCSGYFGNPGITDKVSLQFVTTKI